MIRAAVATAIAGAALVLGACSSDAGSERDAGTGAAPGTGGDVDRVPGQVVDADSLALSPDGDRIAAGCGDRLCVWDTADGALTATYDGGGVVAWSPDGDTLATSGFSDGGATATVVLLDASDGRQLRTLGGHDATAAQDAVGTGVTDLVFSADGEHLASAGHDGAVRVWTLDGETSRETVLETGSEDPDAVAFSPDGERVAIAGPDAPVEVWTVAGERVGTLGEEPQGDVAWSPDGATLATATRAPGPEAAVRTWDAGSLSETGAPDPVPAYRLAWSPDGAALAMTVKDDDTVLVRIRDDLGRLSGHDEQPRALVWSPDGGTLYTASGSDGVLAWDPASGEQVRSLELPGG